MNAFLETFFTSTPLNKTNRQIILWWERRRVLYNTAMLVAGSITLTLGFLLHMLTFTAVNEMLPPILFFGISANLFYTLGWIVEISSRRFISEKELTQKTGPIPFIAGVGFSVFLTFAIDIALLISYFFGGTPSS